MHTNKSAALSNTLTNLLPGSASGKQRNAGMGTELGASFATLFKSSREQTPAVPPKPAAASPAPAPAPAATPNTAAAPSASAKPSAPKPAAARQQAQSGEDDQRKDGDAATTAPASEAKARASARHAAAKQSPEANAAEAEPRAEVDGSDLAGDVHRADAAEVDDEAGVDKAEAGSEEKKAGAQPPQATVTAQPALTPEQLATQLLAASRQPESGEPAAAGPADGATTGGEHRIERAHARPGGTELAAADAAASSGAEPGTAAAANPDKPLARPELAGLQATSEEASGAPLKPASAEGSTALSFQQVLSQASQAQGNPAAGPGAASADTRMLPIRQELHSPGFAPAMGAQLSLLASEGVQSAQLLLNPAEMGPVAVQIVLDGQQAQISFHSDQAETRAVLERSLPDLAAALRENGLTLSGGGVFQQDAGTRQQQADNTAQARGQARVNPTSGAGEHEPLPATPRRAAVARGVLDTYA
jgi:flagellar hook-length control protein FliK